MKEGSQIKIFHSLNNREGLQILENEINTWLAEMHSRHLTVSHSSTHYSSISGFAVETITIFYSYYRKNEGV